MTPKKFLYSTLVIVGILTFYFYAIAPPDSVQKSDVPDEIIQPPERTQNQEQIIPFDGTPESSLFIPYWIIPETFPEPPQKPESNLTTLLYFGITPTRTGINRSEPGYANLSTFTNRFRSSQAYLTIRMLDEDINEHILVTESAQNSVIADALRIAEENGFEGIVLDLEHSVLPSQEIENQITAFVGNFSRQSSNEGLDFTIAVFGDTYFRERPYNIRALEPLVDRIYIMAYDFHKARGEPGPNFPLDSTDGNNPLYAYSFKAMLSDFISDMQNPENLAVTFGMFGYDWTTSEDGTPKKVATPLTLNQAQSRYLPACSRANCAITRDPVSTETQITFQDGQDYHEIWFEDPNSAHEKAQYVFDQGIDHIAFWAYGYY